MATSENTVEKNTTTVLLVEHKLPDEFKSLPLIFSHLRRLLQDNTDYFYKYMKKDVYKRFYDGFNSMLRNTDPVKGLALRLAQKAPHFDYSQEVKGNGYRSLLRLLEHCIRAITEISAYCSTHRDKFYFRSHHYCLEVEAYTNLFQRTRELLQYAKILLDGPEDCLIPETFDSKIMLEVEELDRECFYGRTLGFQFARSLRQFLQVVCIAMASFAEGYHRHGNGTFVSITTSFLNSGKYSVNPELRAKMIVKVTKKTNMEFCKAFWSLTEHYGLQVRNTDRMSRYDVHFVVLVYTYIYCVGHILYRRLIKMYFTEEALCSGKYSVNPELRAKMIVKVTKKTNMEFCKAFWSLTEHYGLQHFPLLVAPAMKVNYVFDIPPDPFELLSVSGEKVSITPPCSWSGPAPVKARLISAEWREGQNKESMNSQSSNRGQLKPKSSGIIFHVHGGGFVAQSSKSHEVYLRVWARELRVPIVSVDYSLAPEAPFPRALEECFFAYAWVLNNADKLGTTAEFVCLAGDSAGGNICVSLSLRAAEYGIRTPDSVLTAYSPFNVQYVPSPSRLLSLMDPLLPTGILAGCLASYAGLDRSPFDECTTKVIKSLAGKSNRPGDVSVQNRKKTSSFLSKFRRSRESKHKSEAGSHSSSSSTGSSPVTGSSIQLGSRVLGSKAVTIPMVGSQGSSVGCESFHSCQSPSSFSASFHKNNDNVQLFPATGYGSEPQKITCPTPDRGNSEIDKLRQSPEPSMTNRSPSSNCSCQGNEFLSESAVLEHQVDHDSLCSLLGNGKIESGANCINSNHVILQPKDLKLTNLTKSKSSPSHESVTSFPDIHLHSSASNPDESVRTDLKSKATSMSQVQLPITKNPFMSPLLAPDDMLSTLPPIDIVACSLDPILDDSVEFARRLRSLGKDVELYILEDLPHGFLNFNLISQEAKEGCDLCITCLKRSLMGKRRLDRAAQAPVF